MRNQEIRTLIKEAGINTIYVAEVLGIHEKSLFNKLKKRLSVREQDELKEIISRLANRTGTIEQAIDQLSEEWRERKNAEKTNE
jgi:hypothetical protein